MTKVVTAQNKSQDTSISFFALRGNQISFDMRCVCHVLHMDIEGGKKTIYRTCARFRLPSIVVIQRYLIYRLMRTNEF